MSRLESFVEGQCSHQNKEAELYDASTATRSCDQIKITTLPVSRAATAISQFENFETDLSMNRIERYLEEGKFKEASTIAEAILLDKFQDLMALEVLAVCKENLGRLDEAIDVRLKISGIVQDFGNLTLLGHLLNEIGDEARAEKCYLQCLVSHNLPLADLFEIEKNLGNILLKRGEIEAAEEHYNRAFGINSNSDALLVNLGTLEIQKGQFALALSRFRTAVAVNAHNDKGWVGLGLIHREYGDHELAFGNVERALDENPMNEVALQLMIDWGLKDGQLDRCISRVERFLDVSSEKNYDIELAYVKVLFCSDRLICAHKQIKIVKNRYPNEIEVDRLFEVLDQKLTEQEQFE